MSTLENASAVLKLFAREDVSLRQSGLSFSDVASRLPLPKSTLSRLLIAMEGQGLLVRNPVNRLYSVGDLFLAVGSPYHAKPLVDLVAPAVERLAALHDCAGFVCVLEKEHVRITSITAGHAERPDYFAVDHLLPAAHTAAGRALLSGYAERDIIARLVPDAPAYAAFSQHGLTRLLERLTVVRRQGWSYARNETRPDYSELATALRHPLRNERVGLCLTFPSLSDSDDFPHSLLTSLKAATQSLAEKIGDDDWLRR
ncbi:IclR family transcriptional regulator [Martelella alba]|uniref:IclR family transcriptional regulator n=1 Tax=Martelella alba TaxID=2590451 RepID=A0ABY2SM49_9HYPH|nr:helix-turn-helix domain-containing protein [Martelella alba]TKI06326.1 IclR family transcriptional regulator [Martelella alba]